MVVTSRVIEESICKGNCLFAFDPVKTNNITLPANTTYDAKALVSIIGSNLTGATVTINDLSIILNTSSSTALSFEYPALPAGDYEIKILTSTGYTSPILISTTTLSFAWGISRSSGPTTGHIVTMGGNGMTDNILD